MGNLPESQIGLPECQIAFSWVLINNCAENMFCFSFYPVYFRFFFFNFKCVHDSEEFTTLENGQKHKQLKFLWEKLYFWEKKVKSWFLEQTQSALTFQETRITKLHNICQ